MKKNIKFFLIPVSFLCVVAILLLFGTRENEDGQNVSGRGGRDQLQTVETATAEKGSIARTLALTGEVFATNQVVISLTKEGTVTYFPWREGDKVESGQQLVTIDREVIRSEAKVAEAELKMVEARLDDLQAGARPEEIEKAAAEVRRWESTLQEAKSAYQRRTELLADEFVTLESVEQARERKEVAEAQLESARKNVAILKAGPTDTQLAVQKAAVREAEAKLELAEAHLAESIVSAPFSGTVTQSHVRQGELVAPRQSLLELTDMSSLVVIFTVPESSSGSVTAGTEVSLVLDAFPEKHLKGEVVRVYPELDRKLRTRTVEAEITANIKAVPGMFARVKIDMEKAEEAVLIPENAVFEKNGAESVFVLENGKIYLREVSVGITDGRNAQILEGLSEGERVVTTSPRNLKDGAEVSTEVRDEAANAGRERGEEGRNGGNGQ